MNFKYFQQKWAAICTQCTPMLIRFLQKKVQVQIFFFLSSYLFIYKKRPQITTNLVCHEGGDTGVQLSQFPLCFVLCFPITNFFLPISPDSQFHFLTFPNSQIFFFPYSRFFLGTYFPILCFLDPFPRFPKTVSHPHLQYIKCRVSAQGGNFEANYNKLVSLAMPFRPVIVDRPLLWIYLTVH